MIRLLEKIHAVDVDRAGGQTVILSNLQEKLRLAAWVLMVLPTSSALAEWQADLSASGFDFCVPPVPPACIDKDATYKAVTGMQDCNTQIQHFARGLGAYRSCLARASERTILQGNEKITHFRCRSARRSPCP